MPTYPIDLLPPRDWQAFEDFCRDLMRAEWGEFAQLHGRQGQGQDGVDVYAMSDGGYVAFQCKSKGQRSDAKLTRKEIEEDVQKAREFEPPLSQLIFATTAQRHKDTQATVRKINEDHREENPPRFTVEVKFWDELVELLQEHPQVYIRWRRRLSLAEAAPKVSTSKLPAASPEKLVGRKAELKRLDEAWSNPKLHALSLIAIGGAGKTSLVDRWNQLMGQDDWRGAEAVFAWSFYSQGAGEDRQASGDQFIDEALRFFGDSDPSEGSPRQRGIRLANLVRERYTLLVLDGLEPIQHGPTHGRPGQIKDPGVSALVRELALSQPGLLVITSRQTVADLKGRTETSAPVVDLERLSTEAGRKLLSHLGVEGKAEELEEVTEEVHGHALTLTLLGTYLKAAHGGDIRAWHDSLLLKQAEMIGDTHATKVMAAYAEWFGEGPERQILSVLGLFDRPADADALAALRKPPAIEGLTDQLVDLPAPRWNIVLDRLRRARLVLEADPARPGVLDAHPLVREHFGRVLETENPEAFRQGHERLYEHYAAAAPEFPDTLPEMEPLYRAIGHGCRAGRRQAAFDEIYFRRLDREKGYGPHKLGAFGSSLTAISNMFDRVWLRPGKDLRTGTQSWLLNEAGWCLEAVGRLDEAVQPMEAGLELDLKREDWRSAARQAENLSHLILSLGDVKRSLACAHRSVGLADRSQVVERRIVSHSILGHTLHASGQMQEAATFFQQAETFQQEYQPRYPKLYSVHGYWYCDFLLSQAAPLDGSALKRASGKEVSQEMRRQCEEVQTMASVTLDWMVVAGKSLSSLALHYLGLGRAELGLALVTSSNLAKPKTKLDQAVQGLREAGREDYLPNGLLARATLHRFSEDVPAAEADLQEALEIAERGSMRLHECDTHLEWGRLRYSVGDEEGAREHLEVARKIVEETGYGRREREVRELSEALA